VALACQMMELLRLDAVCNPPKGATIFQLGVMEKQLLVERTGSANRSMDDVALLSNAPVRYEPSCPVIPVIGAIMKVRSFGAVC